MDIQGERALILTCGHLFYSGVGKVVVTFPSGKQYEMIRPVATGRVDIAAFLIPAAPGMPSVKIAEAMPQRAAEVWQVGYPGMRGPIARAGNFLGHNGFIGGAPVYTTSFDVQPGDSGSGVFNNRSELIGVCAWGPQCTFTGLDTINPFIKEQCEGWCPRIPGFKPPVTPPPASPDCSSRIADLERRIAELEKRPAGKDGRDGTDGRDGVDGKPGKDCDPAALTRLVGIVDGLAKQVDGIKSCQCKDVSAELAKLQEQITALNSKIKNMSGQVRFHVGPMPVRNK